MQTHHRQHPTTITRTNHQSNIGTRIDVRRVEDRLKELTPGSERQHV
jgi:hypothetical protein